MTALPSTVDMFDLRMSDKAKPLYEAVKKFIAEEVEPKTEEYFKLGEGRAERWGYGDGQLELLESIKSKAKEQGLWNFFLPDAETGEGLSNLDYAYIAIELGKNPIASECLNCSAPDTGNMEVLERVGTPEQKEQWLKPLLNGEIRSAYVMTEPDVASSDAKQISCRAERDGDEYVINGEKYYASGAGDPRCKIYIVMLQTDPDGPPHKRGLTREAFGKPLSRLGKNPEVIAKARIEIEACRRMVLTAAKAMDELGNAEARVWVSAVKAMVPIRTCAIVDEAIQIHGATGVSQWTPLARMYASQRTLRLADGPDEVHWFVVGRDETASHEEASRDYDPKVTYYENLENSSADGIFSGP